jgi:hypothetical protein
MSSQNFRYEQDIEIISNLLIEYNNEEDLLNISHLLNDLNNLIYKQNTMFIHSCYNFISTVGFQKYKQDVIKTNIAYNDFEACKTTVIKLIETNNKNLDEICMARFDLIRSGINLKRYTKIMKQSQQDLKYGNDLLLSCIEYSKIYEKKEIKQILELGLINIVEPWPSCTII